MSLQSEKYESLRNSNAPIKIDGDLAIKHLINIAQEFSDRVYSKEYAGSVCVYYKEPETSTRIPQCIVGQVFDRMGVLDQLSSEDNGKTVRQLLESTVEFTGDRAAEAYSALQTAQNYQDEDEPWGVAVDMALDSD